MTGVTNKEGAMKFTGLNAGKFYITAILKEYEFESSSVAVDLQDGDHAKKAISAKRVAFSAFGKVSKLNGLPLSHGRILAKCEGCERVEEAKIDQDGSFRVRGL